MRFANARWAGLSFAANGIEHRAGMGGVGMRERFILRAGLRLEAGVALYGGSVRAGSLGGDYKNCMG